MLSVWIVQNMEFQAFLIKITNLLVEKLVHFHYDNQQEKLERVLNLLLLSSEMEANLHENELSTLLASKKAALAAKSPQFHHSITFVHEQNTREFCVSKTEHFENERYLFNEMFRNIIWN